MTGVGRNKVILTGAGSSPTSDSPMVADCSFAGRQTGSCRTHCCILVVIHTAAGVGRDSEPNVTPPFLQLTEDTDAHLYRVDKET